jgi:nitrate reductase delta subunit
VIELAGETVRAPDAMPAPAPEAADAALDQSWQEPPVFDGCASAASAPPQSGNPQPIQIVRRPASATGTAHAAHTQGVQP